MAVDRTAGYYDSIAEHYEEDYQDDPYWDLVKDLTWQDLLHHLPKSRSLIADIGGGTGFWARKIAKQGHDVVVTDISENMLNVGQAKARRLRLDKHILFRVDDVCDMPDMKTARYDIVLALGDVLCYARSPEKAVSELARIAKPGAKIIVSVKSFFATLKFTLSHEPKSLPALQKTHILSLDSIPYYSFTPEELKALFQNNGCRIVSLVGRPVFASSIGEFGKIRKELAKLERMYGSHDSLLGSADSLFMVVEKT